MSDSYTRFLSTLSEHGFALFLPTSIWNAYQAGLLPEIRIPKFEKHWFGWYRNRIESIEEIEKYMAAPTSIPHWAFNDEKGHEHFEMFAYRNVSVLRQMWKDQHLPRPQFTDKETWKACDYEFLGPGHYGFRSLPDGSVIFAFRLRFWLSKEIGRGDYSSISPIIKEFVRQLKKEYGIKSTDLTEKDWYDESVSYKVNVSAGRAVVGKIYKPDQVRKIRRQLEDRLRKSEPSDILRAANLFSLV